MSWWIQGPIIALLAFAFVTGCYVGHSFAPRRMTKAEIELAELEIRVRHHLPKRQDGARQ